MLSKKSKKGTKNNWQKSDKINVVKKIDKKVTNLMLSSGWNVPAADRRWCNPSIQIGIGLQFITDQDLYRFDMKFMKYFTQKPDQNIDGTHSGNIQMMSSFLTIVGFESRFGGSSWGS